MNKNQHNRAFTLIELLVVVAIISLLSSVVLASLNSARDNATEASILSSLKNISTQAEIYRTNEGTYEGLCDDSKIEEMVGALDNSSEGAACSVDVGNYTNLNADEESELYKIDYGVAALANDTYYGADSRGVYTFDAEDHSSTLKWFDNTDDSYPAAEHCATTGGRLPGPSTLQAKYDLDTTAGGFTASGYWSYLESPSDPSDAYITDLGNVSVAGVSMGYSYYVRCVH